MSKELEHKELDVLLQDGVEFEVNIQGKSQKFTIKEPTLSVLDRMSKYWIEIDVDDSVFSENGKLLDESKRLISMHAKDVATIIAIAVLGEGYHSKFACFSFNRERKLNQLTKLFYKAITPSKLIEITQVIIAACSLGNFTSSMRLMSASRTTKPTHRIEKED